MSTLFSIATGDGNPIALQDHSMLRAIAYKSRASDELTPGQIEVINRRSVAFNRIAGVTGVLLYDGRYFFQYLEGPEDGLNAVLGQITSSAWHSGMVTVMSQPIEKRRLPYWSMSVRALGAAELHLLLDANWEESAPSESGATAIEWLTDVALVRSSPLVHHFPPT